MSRFIYTHSYHYPGYTSETVSLTGYNFERRINELRSKLSVEKPDVFVSHKSDDTDIAQEVAETIAKSRLTAYLDVLDSNITGDGPELVDYINTIIGCCDSLVAVVSHNTVRSWWVPLEIGIAMEKGLHLGTFLVLTSIYTKRDFPSYLWKWPVLTDMIDLENWCKERRITTTTQRFYESLDRKYPYMFRQ